MSSTPQTRALEALADLARDFVQAHQEILPLIKRLELAGVSRPDVDQLAEVHELAETQPEDIDAAINTLKELSKIDISPLIRITL